MIAEEFFQQADEFIQNEKQFQLGFLPTEQSNPKTRDLDLRFQESVVSGVRCLQTVDRDIPPRAKEYLNSPEWIRLRDGMVKTIRSGGRVVFSGCGATGRLSILLECMWRSACAGSGAGMRYADSVESIMTGGDYALVRSVEFFEDYQSFGRRQVVEADLKPGDMLVAITEGGETSSVLGTVFESLDRGLTEVFLLFNNPASLLAGHLERCRKAISDPRVCVLDLSCGPMALAGSTRMQATTSEQLCAGSALENAFDLLTGHEAVRDFTADFIKLLDSLESERNRTSTADWIEFEASVYAEGGKITYLADEFMLDIFTDTTERSPTFMLPPFRRRDDERSPQSWAFVKNPLDETGPVWRRVMHRALRCLNWNGDLYRSLGAERMVASGLPAIAEADLLKIPVGAEHMEIRNESPADAAIRIISGNSPDFRRIADSAAGTFRRKRTVSFDGSPADFSFTLPEFSAYGIGLFRHLGVKLILNTVSTGTMARLGRVSGNWMSWVDCTNKKLLDRGTRLISELAPCDYRTACAALFEAMSIGKTDSDRTMSPVQRALEKIGKKEIRS